MQLTNICEVKEWVEQNTNYRVESYEYVVFAIGSGQTAIQDYKLNEIKGGYYTDNSYDIWMFSGNIVFKNAGTYFDIVYPTFKGTQSFYTWSHNNCDIYLNFHDAESDADWEFIGYVLRLIKK